METIFVTGGSGFIGRHLLAALQKADIPVRALVRSAKSAAIVAHYGAEPIHASLTDEQTLQQAMAGCTTVYHLAATMDHTVAAAVMVETIVTGTEVMLRAAKQAKVKRFIYLGSAAIFAGGKPLVNADETWEIPAHPVGIYPQTKAQAEQAVMQANNADFTTIVLRPCYVWGVGDTANMPQILDNVRQKRFTWIDNGNYRISTCHVENVVAGMLAARERGNGGHAYFLTDGSPITLREFFDGLISAHGLDAGERTSPRWLVMAFATLLELPWKVLPLKSSPPDHLRSVVHLLGQENTVSDAKAQRELGYKPVVSREQGLHALRASIQCNGS